MHSGQTANFVTTPDTRNVLGRVKGGASYINGLIQVLGSSSNLFLMNPAGIMFGPNASLNVPASFSVTTATGIGFDQNNFWFKAMGTNDYSNLVGNPSGYRFDVSKPGSIVNEGNLTLKPQGNLTLSGGTVVNTGELSSPGGNITVTAVEGGSTLKISQPGHLLSLEVPLEDGENISNIDPLSLPELLAGGGDIVEATSVVVKENGDVVLNGSNTMVAETPGTATISGKIDVSTTATSLKEKGRVPSQRKKEGAASPGKIDVPPSLKEKRDVAKAGKVNVWGDRVALIDTNIKADGKNGGGTVLIGGDFQGLGIVPNSQHTFVNNNSFISADAITNGDGGQVRIWSDGITNFAGNISAKGGTSSGNGGLVKIGGKEQLIFDGKVDVTAALGTKGRILLDPESVTVGEDNSEGEKEIVEDNSEVSETENTDNYDGEIIEDNSEVSETENTDNYNGEIVEDNSEVSETENTDNSTTKNTDNLEDKETENPLDPFAADENSDVTISADNLGELSGNVIIDADNDITINERIETDSSVELKAGRSININADIDTKSGNGNIDLLGNNDEMNLANRSDGKGSINQLDGTILNAGSGGINIKLGSLGEVGDINLGNLRTTGKVLVDANGGNIVRVSENSLINAGSVLFRTSGNGGIGFLGQPLRLDVQNLEAVSGSGGVFFDVGNVNIGGVSEDVVGIATFGGDVDIKSAGNVTLNETISSNEVVENNSEGGTTENTEVVDGGGGINIEAAGDIVATGSGIKGGGEAVSLSGTNIRINDEFDETSGDADVKLSATNDIVVEDIEDDVLEFMPGSGEIEFRADKDGDGFGLVKMLDNKPDVGSNPDIFENGADTIKTNGRGLTIAGAGLVLGNVDTSWLPIYSGGGELLKAIDVDEGGPIPPEGTEGTTTFTFTVDGDLGTVENIDVRFSAAYTHTGDLDVSLESPQGKVVQLFAGVGRWGDNFQDTVLDDNASRSIGISNAPFDGRYSPQGSLVDFNGENPKGIWTLKVKDTNIFSNLADGNLYRAGETAPWGTAIGTQLLLHNPLVKIAGGIESGKGGAINLEATHGDISVGNIRSLSEAANGGRIDLNANKDIITGLINSSSASVQGNGGAIDLDAGGNITTQSLNSRSYSWEGNSGNGGTIDLDAGGNITTQSLYSSSYSGSGNSGDGGAIDLDAGGDITTTQDLDSSSYSWESNLGNGGAIDLDAGGNITTQVLDSRSFSWEGNSGNGGAIDLDAGGNITTQILDSCSYSGSYDSGNGGAIDLVAGGDITTQNLYSDSFSRSGNSGNGGAIDLVAGGDITIQDLYSFSYSGSGNSGNGGDITLNAKQINPPEDGNAEKLTIYTFSAGKKESEEGKGGDVNITTNNLSNTDILTLSSHSGSGKVTIESQTQEPLQIKDSSIITSEKITITMPWGEEIQVETGDTQSGDVSINSSGDLNLSNVTIESDTESNQAAGDVNIYSRGNITLENTDIISTTNSQGNAGQITLESNQNIELTNNSKILANTEGTGNAGQINIEANKLILDQNTKLITETARAGNPGNINIQANTIDIGEGAKASTTVLTGSTSTGEGGNITINTNELNVTGKLGIFAETEASKNAGILRISPYKNNPDLDITFKNEGFISASTSSTGNGGNIFIKAPENINITGQGFIATKTSGTGNAGIIDIKTNNLRISNGVKINASTEDQGNAGEIKINTTDFTLEKGTSLTTETSSAGLAGNIEINTKNLTIGQNAQISATALEGASNKEAGGNITINANNLDISGKLGIFAETAGESPAGTLTLNPYKNNPNLNIEFKEKGFISARTTSSGNGGNINIQAPEKINITGDGKISAETTGSGNAGTINIQTENLNLSEQVAISAETNSQGQAGNIEINSQTVTIGKGTEISATAGKKATSTGDGGNITINTNDLEISGKLGIFAETKGASNAGTLTITPYQTNPDLNSKTDPNINITFTDQGFISASTKSLGKGGDINILAPENINITGDGRITVESEGSGDAGIINIETENLTIAENTKISASTSDSGNGGEIKINSSETFQLQGRILTETTGTGDGGIINIEAGEITAPNSKISAKTTDAGNAGTIDITAQGDITTGVVTSAAKNDIETADGGSISITSEQGKINATRAIQSFSEGGNAGNVTLKAQTDITANTISSHGKQEGGQITIRSETGNIDTSSGKFLANYSGGGDAGDITMEAPQGNITTNNIYSYADGDGGQINIKAGNNINIEGKSNIISASKSPSDGSSDMPGKGGDITLEAGNNINTRTAKIYSGANEGDTGKIDITADNAIETGKIDLVSGFVKEKEKVNENFTIIPKGEGEATQGKAGDIRLRSRNSTIDTTGGTINSRSPDGTGNIIINAKGNISTGKLEASALNPDKPTTGGDVNITSEQGEINATQNIETFSEQGIAGDVNITAFGQIQTNNISSQGMKRGGDINIRSDSESSIDAAGVLQTYSDAGTAGNVNLTSPGDVNISGIRSEGMEQGGDINIRSERGEINSTGDIDSYSKQGKGGYVKVDALERVNLANVSSYGMTESGDLIIQSQQAKVNTGNVTTQALEGKSGRIVINGTEVGTGNLSSIGTTSAGEIKVTATDGSIKTYNVEIRSDGTIGVLSLKATEDINTGDQTAIAGEGDVFIDNDAGDDLTTGDQTAITGEGDAFIDNDAGDDLTTGDQTAITGGGDVFIDNDAGDDLTTGDQTAITGGGDAFIDNHAGDELTTGDQTAITGGGDAFIDNDAGDDLTTGEKTVITGNVTATVTNFIQNDGVDQNLDTTVTNFIQNDGVNQNLDTTSVISNNNIPNNQVLNQENFSNNNNNNIENNSTTNSSNNKNILSNLTQSQRSELISNSTLSNNNQTTNTNTAQEQTESSINSTTDTQKILNIIDTVNTNSLTVATGSDQVITMLEQNLTNEYSNYFGTDFKEQFINQKTPREILTDMAAKTGKESAVVYINAYPEELQIILYTKDGQPILKTIPEANRKKLEKVVINFLKLTTSPAYRDFNSYLSPAKQLYDWFIAPISAELEAANIDTLLFSMGEGLRILPVAALHDGKQFLIEKYSLSLIPSISLMDTNYRPLQGTQVLAMGASKFINEKPLPAVPVEIETISEQLWEGSKFLNEEFTKNNLLTQRKNYPYPIIHLATHATFNRGKPSNSYIQLWGNEQIKLDQVRELGWSTPSVDLLVLSACRTAVGNREAELGFAGLAVAAGVKSALTSLWTVSDEGTLALMTEFYTHLNNVSIKAEALRQAQLAMLQGQVLITGGELRGSSTRGGVELPSAFANVNNQNLSHPYYWAGFTMVGSPW
ncbi:filamentous haemagglutinin family outer membrane protein [Trichodesmium erythraeum IMS101]|uniref:Filamentous haemagglutinin family outer membrane protein n=1 Tax=Trichodesmium erythraeum (strain IMS101) TaxID=203124 RepID=Q118Q6_TRIEI